MRLHSCKSGSKPTLWRDQGTGVISLSKLANVIAEVQNRTQYASWISVFLDFDGTLVPISANPTEPQLDSDTAEALKLISNQDLMAVTVISGRAVEDLYGRIRIDGLVYAGNHGLEIFGRGLRFVEPRAWSRREQLAALSADLAAELQDVAGIIVEHKGLTSTVHYRNAAAEDVPRVRAAVAAAVARQDVQFLVNDGRKVFEIVPRTEWHKGAAARWINSHLRTGPTLSIYVGDDTSDEYAFHMLSDAITIKVGNGATNAQYRLPDPTAVHELILWLAAMEISRPGRA
jgi:trehalose-phosphatase